MSDPAAQDVLPPPVQDALSLDAATVTPQVSTSSARPDAHTQRYDRQLRLWASSGQSALENASILVVNGSATASSTLKNLVLPGIGKYTILDPKTVDGSDVGNNFFLEPSSVGKSRAQEVTRLLSELNGDVKGEAVVQDLATFLSSPMALATYSLIIAVDCDPSQLINLSDLAWDQQIPLIKVHSCGFYGAIRVQINELPIVETHPESLVDLRVHAPFPALVQYAETFDYSKMDSAEHGHVPAVIILVKALQQWRSSHDGKGPSSTAERKEFIQTVLKEKKASDEENFDEAVTLFRRAGTRTGIPDDIKTLFEDASCQNLTKDSSNFWLLTRAVLEFTRHPSNADNLLPLSGALPDMKADSRGYVGLQNLYKQKARADLEVVRELLGQLSDSAGIDRSRVADEEIETFVKHSAFLKVVRGRSLRQEYESSALKGEVDTIRANAQFSETPDNSLPIYFGLLAAERFVIKHGRYPGASEADTDGTQDHAALKDITAELLKEVDGGEIDEQQANVLEEICRAGGSDLPQIAALLGGVVGQEAIKLVTKQYVPLNGTCIFDGIKSSSGVIKG